MEMIYTIGLIVLLLICIIIGISWRIKETNKDLEIGQATCIGKREFQEDAHAVVSARAGTMALVVDGRGKNKSGKLSSGLVMNVFTQLFEDEISISNVNYFFKKAFHITNREILKQLGDIEGGASVVAAIMIGNLLHYAVVGNAMIAIYRKGELIALSEGHTLNVLAKKGYYEGKINRQQALSALKEKRIFNYVGQDGFKEIEFYDAPVKLKKEDLIVLMSDGIHDYLPWGQMEDIIKTMHDPQKIADQIIKKLQNEKIDNQDNATIIAMKYRGN